MAAKASNTVVQDKVEKKAPKPETAQSDAAEATELEITEEDIRKLVNRGKRRGHLTQEELLEAFPDIEAAMAELEAKGADIQGEIREGRTVARYGFVVSPENVRVEVVQP